MAGVTPAIAANPSVFATTPGHNIIGIAAAPGRLLVTTYCDVPRRILSFDSSGAQSTFSTLPADSRGTACEEDYIAISPGLGGFVANHVFVDQGPNVVEVDASGTFVGILATIPSLPPDHNGIAFDHSGLFGFDLIITGGGNGEVWTVSSLGITTKIATITGQTLEGPDVAPLAFAPYGGQILVASESANVVYAISSGGVVSTVASVSGAEFVHFVPPNPCSFGTSGGSLFDVLYPTTIDKFPASDLSGLSGSALVTGEFSGAIETLTSSSGTIVSGSFQTGLGQQEGATIVDCAVPPVIGGVPQFGIPATFMAAASLLAIVGVRYISLKRRFLS